MNRISCSWALSVAVFVSAPAWAQSLVLSSVAAAPGSTATLSLSLAGAGTQPAGLQWTLAYPTSGIVSVSAAAGAVLQSSGKSLSCVAAAGKYTCVAAGLNANAIPDGVVATVSVNLASTLSSTATVTVGGTMATSVSGGAISLAGMAGTITPATTAPPPPVSASSTAGFLGLNSALQGRWKTSFGADGYAVAGDMTRYPAYAAVSLSAPNAFIWAPTATDTRALQKASSPTDAIAAAWSGASLSIDINLTDGQTHQVGIYCLDWDGLQRAQTVSIVDASTGAVLDSRGILNFGTGVYAMWNLSGHVKIHIALNSGPNVAVSGVFFGGAAKLPRVSFVKSDTATQGSWQAMYGAEGYNVIGSMAASPGYVNIAGHSASQYVWSASTSDPRALQKPDSPADRIAATWYGTSFSIDLNFSDTVAHQVALYCLDWNSKGRTETIIVSDPATNAVLDTRAISNFSGGEYLIWNLRGTVRITITSTNTATNAVVSGIFFGGAAARTAADFVQTDVATQGTWTGAYGADGYNVIGNLTSYPPYAAVTPSGESAYVWSSFTTDPRGLQLVGNPSSRIAATWFSDTGFSIDVNLSNAVPHQVAVYCLDWNNEGRVETVAVLDAATNAVLDSRTITNFVGGQYLVWNLSGHVKITFTPVRANAVISGIFFR